MADKRMASFFSFAVVAWHAQVAGGEERSFPGSLPAGGQRLARALSRVAMKAWPASGVCTLSESIIS
jgi:hypothetical protein